MRRLSPPPSLQNIRKKLQMRMLGEAEVDLPPREVLRPEMLAGLKRLDLRAKVLLRGFLQGLHRSPRPGFSVEFSDFRNFTQGDDSRWIDWRLFARTDRLYVKRFEAESALRATLLIDASASMGYLSTTAHAEAKPAFTKLGYAVTLAAAFAYLLHFQRDRIGLLRVGGQSESAPQGLLRTKRIKPQDSYIPPKASKRHLMRLLMELSALKAGGAQSLPEALENFSRLERRSCLLVIFSDGLCGRAQLVDALQRLKHRGHDLIFFQIWDREERFPQFEPGWSLQDPESKAIYAPLPLETYVEKAERHLERMRQEILTIPAEYQYLETTDPFDRALFKFLRMRKAKS